MNLYLNKINTGPLYTTNSTFGPVNDLMLQQALIMLTQSNAFLYPLLNGAVVKWVTFEVPEKIDHILPLPTWAFDVFEDSVGIFIDPEPWWNTEEEFVAMLERLFQAEDDFADEAISETIQ